MSQSLRHVSVTLKDLTESGASACTMFYPIDRMLVWAFCNSHEKARLSFSTRGRELSLTSVNSPPNSDSICYHENSTKVITLRENKIRTDLRLRLRSAAYEPTLLPHKVVEIFFFIFLMDVDTVNMPLSKTVSLLRLIICSVLLAFRCCNFSWVCHLNVLALARSNQMSYSGTIGWLNQIFLCHRWLRCRTSLGPE